MNKTGDESLQHLTAYTQYVYNVEKKKDEIALHLGIRATMYLKKIPRKLSRQLYKLRPHLFSTFHRRRRRGERRKKTRESPVNTPLRRVSLLIKGSVSSQNGGKKKKNTQTPRTYSIRYTMAYKSSKKNSNTYVKKNKEKKKTTESKERLYDDKVPGK